MKRNITKFLAALALLVFTMPSLVAWGQTYKLQAVTSIEAGGLYVFEQNGHVMNNTVSNSALQTTDSYNTTGLEGTETYVWTLETATNGFYLKNVSLSSNQYLNNSSSTGVSFGTNSSIWAFNFQTDNTVLIQNISNSNRFLGYTSATSYAYKAYATSNLSSYPHAIVVYQLIEESSSTPSIFANNVSVAYDATEGAIEYTINNGTGLVTAEITGGNEGNWLTLGTVTSTEVPFTCSTNTGAQRTATVTLSYTGASDKVVTVTQTVNPNLSNIAALTGQNAGNYSVTLNEALVTYVNGTNAYLEDASGAVMLYHCAGDLAVGDKITGTANVTFTVYNNLPEVTAITLAEGYTKTTGNTVTPLVITIAALESNYTSYISRYVKIENATVTSAFSNRNSTIEQNGSSIVLRDQNNPGILTTNVDDIVTVTAHPSIYSTTHQIAVYEQSQIVVAKVDPTITFNNGTVRVGNTLDLNTLFTSNSTGTVTFSITAGDSYATLSGSELTGTAEGTVTVKAQQAESASHNAGEATATITVEPALVLSSIAITTPPTKTTYNEGETFDPTGMVVTATYTDNSTEAVTGYTYSPDGALTTDDTEITISYTENDVTKTATQAITVNEVIDYATLPFEWEGGASAYFLTLNGVTANGLGSDYGSNHDPYNIKFDNTGDYIQVKCNQQPGKVTIGVKMVGGATTSTITVQGSADGETFTNIQALTISGAQNSELTLETTSAFASTDRYVRMLFTKGSNVGVGPISIAVPSTEPSITLESYVINVDAAIHQEFLDVTFENFEPTTGYAFTCDANGTFTDYSWLVAELDINNSRVRCTIGNNEEEEARTGYFRVKCGDVYSDIVTVNQAAYVPPFAPATYTLATSIESGKTYIITNGIDKAMGAQGGNNRPAVDVEIENDVATVSSADVYEFVIESIGDGYYSIYDSRYNDNEGGYLYAASSSSNYLKTETELDDNGNGNWAISIENGVFSIVANGTNTRNVMQYNNGSTLFSCYSSDSQSPVYLYEKVEDAEYTLEITGYSDDNVKDGYHLIASPVYVNPFEVEGIAEGDFDFYYFDQSEDDEWRNYETSAFTLQPGIGYLYAKKATYEGEVYSFNLVGEPYIGDGLITLSYCTNEGVDFPGLNLIGNPFGEEATLNLPFYRMNEDGSALEAVEEGSTVNVMEGVFVYAEYDPDNGVTNYAQFTPSGSNYGGGGGMKLNVTSKRGSVVDNAIVRFDNGRQLPKFQLNPNSTKLYIPQGNKDFAIVRSAAEGEMPVSFKAAENGTYTLAVETENVEMNYLHLIDNLTGMDVDLLQTPSYTFEARTNDYTSRFRLVFKGNSTEEQTTETFAYFNGTSWTVSNLGEATLQVVDVIGRLVSTEQINGNATINLNETPGIYMLRLVNGNDVKVQKIVVR